MALVGRDLGDDSPEIGSWPKKPHFFADLGVEGVDAGEVTDSASRGIELRLGGNSRLGVSSERGSAVRGRLSVAFEFEVGASPRLSFGGGEEPADMIEDIELVTEWPCLTVLALSDETTDKGRGMISTKSENPTRLRLRGLALGLGSALRAELAACKAESRESWKGEALCTSVEGDVGAETPPFEREVSGFRIILKSWQDMAADLR